MLLKFHFCFQVALTLTNITTFWGLQNLNFVFCYFRSICHSSNFFQLQDDRFNSIVTDHELLSFLAAHKHSIQKRIYHRFFIYHFGVQHYFSFAVHLQELLAKWIQQIVRLLSTLHYQQKCQQHILGAKRWVTHQQHHETYHHNIVAF